MILDGEIKVGCGSKDYEESLESLSSPTLANAIETNRCVRTRGRPRKVTSNTSCVLPKKRSRMQKPPTSLVSSINTADCAEGTIPDALAAAVNSKIGDNYCLKQQVQKLTVENRILQYHVNTLSGIINRFKNNSN